MGVINSEDINGIIGKALSFVDKKIVVHGEIVGYIFYKMLQGLNRYSLKDLIDFTMIGVLHDIGLFKSSNSEEIQKEETKYVWKHSIYGYLFLRYLSPIGEKAEIILYHHLDYKKYHLIRSQYIEIAEYLSFADKLDICLHMEHTKNKEDFFANNAGVTYSERAKQLFLLCEKKYHILNNIKTGEYQNELKELFAKQYLSEESKRGYLQMLIYTIDFRSEFTVLHSMGTTTFAVELARLMRLSNQDIYKIYYGALLHDIGKLATPIEILEAPRKLTDEEMAIMKEHVANTETILRGVVHDDIVEIAIRHHEKLDGTGYHRGLKADDLTIPQRIVGVADIISALYQKRSYKDKFDKEKIISILTNDAENNKICPVVAGCAVRNMNQLLNDFEKRKKQTFGSYTKIKEQYAKIYTKFEQYDMGN